MIYLYKITNTVNNKIYIGVHKNKIDSIDDGYMGSGKHLKYAQKKYGIENFKKELLEFFDTYNNALDKERIIVDESFIARKDTYNIRIGGRGGNFSKEDAIRGATLGGQAYKDKVKSLAGDDLIKYKERMTIQSMLGIEKYKTMYEENDGIWWKNGFKDKVHSEDTLGKMRGERPHTSGKKNSQYGTCWITNGNQCKKIKKDDIIPPGWKKAE